jgi:predicted cupin superfamily sugar epimerase
MRFQWLRITLYVMALNAEPDARSLISTYGMVPHPEGGWYAETYRAPAAPGVRPVVSAIYFLLQKGELSRWHTVDACEIWLWHAGSPLHLHLGRPGEKPATVVLGSGLGLDIGPGEKPQAVVPPGVWQAAESAGAWTLVSCIVAPAFEFAGFTLAPEGWMPGPQSIESGRVCE